MTRNPTAKPARPEIRLTAGKGIANTTIEELLDKVVKDVKVRSSLCPACIGSKSLFMPHAIVFGLCVCVSSLKPSYLLFKDNC
jgi:hypothetical protein